MLAIKIIILLWIIAGALLGVMFCYSDESDGVFDGIDIFTLIVAVLLLILIGPAVLIYIAIKHHMKRR